MIVEVFGIGSLASLLHLGLPTFLVRCLLHFLRRSVPLILDFLITLADTISTGNAACLLLLGVLLVQMGQALNHRMDLLLLRVHEHLLERSLGWQS